ncbi:MAG: DUF4230 domain-containing protein [Cruoricaptor ignavus]|nr:DUF4230 domain-containing protein [Cruoricaptor ignavus]
MRNIKNYFIAFVLGIGVAIALFFSTKFLWKKNSEQTRNDYYIITNQIKKMNKMVVVEQEASSMQKTKMTSELLGGFIPPFEKEIITLTKTNAQVTYDLNRMDIKVDSINKKLIITTLPEADIKIIPSVEIQSMDDSFFNRINEKDIRKITESAKETAIKNINQNQLRTEGRKQLTENLNQIFVLAKALNYTIEDQTGQIEIAL